MDIDTLTRFFMWCTIINLGLFAYWVAACLLVPDVVYRMQVRFFPVPRETWDVAVFAFLGLFKVVVVVFNLVPWLALLIVG